MSFLYGCNCGPKWCDACCLAYAVHTGNAKLDGRTIEVRAGQAVIAEGRRSPDPVHRSKCRDQASP